MENLLNLLWIGIAIAALLTAPRRSGRVSLALGCALALLFPIVSVSDDLLTDRDSFEEALAIVVKAVILLIAMVTIARIESIRPRRVTLLFVPPSDPRSPPQS
jgi:Na+/H+ antiporter NhaD/arsenite permease-like protein